MQCRGQGICSVARKTSGKALDVEKMCLKEDATLSDFCESSRLLFHASNALNGQDLWMDNMNKLNLSSADRFASEAYTMLKIMATGKECDKNTKQNLVAVILNWTKRIDQLLKLHQYTENQIIEDQLKEWLYRIRIKDLRINSPVIPSSTKEHVNHLMGQIDDRLLSKSIDSVILIAQAGSSLYGLEVPESDTDYVIVYSDPLKKIMTSLVRPAECQLSRGPDKNLEYGAYEVRLLCQMMRKGSVDILELVFCDNLDYCSDWWKDLQKEKNKFVTETAVQNYFDMIERKIKKSGSANHKEHQRKYLYQAFHKLYCVEEMIEGCVPIVRLSGEKKDFIMNIRQHTNDKDYSLDLLTRQCSEKLNQLRHRFNNHNHKLPINISKEFLTKWLLSIRGVNTNFT